MPRLPYRLTLGAALIMLLAACTSVSLPVASPTASASRTIPSSTQTSPTSTTTPSRTGFSVDIQQAQAITTVMNMIQAYNAGRLEETLAFFDENIGYSDCDYRAMKTISGRGKDETTQWLRHQFADHDQLIIRSIDNENPVGEPVVGVAYTRRTNDTLRSLGFLTGIEPNLATKVIFTPTRDRITAFANGPYGGSSDLCRPESVP